MKRIGIVVAVEVFAVLEKYGEVSKKEVIAGFNIYKYVDGEVEIYVIESGVGQIAASAATAILISNYHVDLIVNFGVVGGLTEEMSKTSMCIIDKVVHYDFDTSKVDNVEVGRYLNEDSIYIPASQDLVDKAVSMEKGLKRVICASGDKFVDGEERQILRDKFKADICEMEAAGIVITSRRAGVPNLLIKVVSDGIKGGADEFRKSFEETSRICFDIADRLIRTI